MKKILVMTTLVLAFVFASSIYVSAESPLGALLQGNYSLIGQQVCVRTPFGAPNQNAPEGFERDSTFALKLAATTVTTHFGGTLNLSSNGTGTAEGVNMSINHQKVAVGDKPMSVWESICTTNYQGLPDGSIQITVNDCEGSITAGEGSPGDFFVTGMVYNFSKRSVSGEILLHTTLVPSIETVEYYYPYGPYTLTFKAERICTRSVTAIRSR